MEPTATEVTLTGKIGGTPSRREALEGAIRAAFRGLHGSWSVEVIPARHSSWWLIRVDGARGFHRAVLAGRRDHAPENLLSIIRQSLRGAEKFSPQPWA